jgi:glycosyltransferase involved in cell wall biosynthesis
MRRAKTLTVVIPVHDECPNVAPTVARTRAVLESLDLDWTILFVDDGSSDGTTEAVRLQNLRDARVGGLSFSRNFGKEAAMAAGLRHAAAADAVVLMDGDLQHPPETIPAFVAAWRTGAEVVQGHRRPALGESPRRRAASEAFYALFRRLSQMPLEAGAVDFVLLDRVAVAALNRMGERTRFTKGLFHWIGFRTAVVPFDCAERNAGRSTFTPRRLLAFAVDGIVAFSSLPLRIWSGVGAAISTGAILYAVYFAIRTLVFGADVPGFPSLIVSITFLSGIQLLSLGVIGEYLSRIYEETKARPLFLVREVIGADASAVARQDTTA